MNKMLIDSTEVLASNVYSQHYYFSIPWKLRRPDTDSTLKQLRHLFKDFQLEYDSYRQ